MKVSDIVALGLIALGGMLGVVTMNAWPLIVCLLAACLVLVVCTPEWGKARRTIAEASQEPITQPLKKFSEEP